MSTYHTPHQQHHSDNEMMIISQQQQQQVTDKTDIIDDTNHNNEFSKNENSYPSSSSSSSDSEGEDDEEEDEEDDDNEDDNEDDSDDSDDDDDYEEEMFTIQAADGPYLIDLDTAMLCSALRKQLMQDSNHRTFTISNVRRKSLEKVFDWCRFHCPQKKPTTTTTTATPSTKSICHSSVSHTLNSTSTNDECSSSSLSSSLTMLNESNNHHHHHHHVNTSSTIMTTHHNQNSENTSNKKKKKRRKKKKKTVLRKPVIDLTRRPSTEERKRYDRKLVDAEPSDLCELASASYYLQIRPLVDLTCQSIATLIKGKTPEEVRETFNIANDFIHNNASHHNGIHGGGGDANGSETNGVQSDEAETTMVAQAALKSKNRNSMIGPPSMSHLHHLHHHHHHPMGLHSAKNSSASKSWLHRNYPFTNNPEVIERMRATDPLSMPYDKMNEPTTTSKSKKKNQKKKKKKAEKRKLKDKRSVDDLVSFITADDAKKKPTQHQQKSKKKDKKKKPQQKANDSSSLSSKSSVLGTSTAASSVSSTTSVNSEADIESEASSNSTEQVDHHDADSIASNFYYSDEEEERMALDNNFDFNSLMHQIQSQSYDDELAVAEEEGQFEEQEENVNVDDHLTESIEQEEEEAQDHSSSSTTEEGIPNESPVLTTTLESTVARQEQTETESPKESNPAPTESLDDISSVDELLQRINQVEQELERERTENQMVLSQLQQRTSFLESQLAQQAQQMYGMYNLVVEQQAYIQRLTQPSSFHVNEFYQQQQHVESYHTVGPVGSVRQPTPPNAHQKLFEMFPQSSPTVVPSLSPTSPLPSPDLFNGINQPRNPSPSLFSTGGPTGYLYKK